jgi:hypothetical protein
VKIFLKKSGDLMVSYFKSPKKNTFDIPYIYFKFYSNIVFPSWVEFDPCTQPKRGAVEEDFGISRKLSMTLVSTPSSFHWNAFNNIPSMA